MHSVVCTESRGIGHAHFHLPFFFFFFADFQNVKNLLFWTPLWWFHQFARNLTHSIYRPSWQKVIKRLLIGQLILKLLNNNFLQIWLKTESVAYPHWCGLMTWNSGYYFPMSPWGPVQNFRWWALFKFKYFISPQCLIWVMRNFVHLLSVPFWGQLIKGLPIRH